MNMKELINGRGFKVIEFMDRYNVGCTIQESSLCDAIWFGVNEAEPKILASDIMEDGTGWAKYPIPNNVLINTRMHLTVDQVRELIPILQKFVDTGRL